MLLNGKVSFPSKEPKRRNTYRVVGKDAAGSPIQFELNAESMKAAEEKALREHPGLKIVKVSWIVLR